MDLYLLAELKTISLKVKNVSFVLVLSTIPRNIHRTKLIMHFCTFPNKKVTTVDMQKPPPDFRTNFEATHPPILIDNGLAILENDKIERHIMKSIPGGYNLFVQVSEPNRQRAFNEYSNTFISPF